MNKPKTIRLSGNGKLEPSSTSVSGTHMAVGCKLHPVAGREHAVLTTNQGVAREEGKIGWVLLWLLGIPIPILVLLYLLRGCT